MRTTASRLTVVTPPQCGQGTLAISVTPQAKHSSVDHTAAGIATAKLPWWRGWLPLLLLPALRGRADAAELAALAVHVAAGVRHLRRLQMADVAAHAGRRVIAWRHAGYLLAWPGLDAVTFLSPRPLPPERRPTPGEWLFAAAKTLGGAAVLSSARYLVPPGHDLVLGWCGLIGIAFLLHFGTFHLLSCCWRALGVAAVPLMHHPWAATSVC